MSGGTPNRLALNDEASSRGYRNKASSFRERELGTEKAPTYALGWGVQSYGQDRRISKLKLKRYRTLLGGGNRKITRSKDM